MATNNKIYLDKTTSTKPSVYIGIDPSNSAVSGLTKPLVATNIPSTFYITKKNAIGTGTLASYVVDYGYSGDASTGRWFWKKWSNGYAEAWYSLVNSSNFTNEGTTGTNSNTSYTRVYKLPATTFPISWTARPMVFCNRGSIDTGSRQDYFVCDFVGVTQTSPATRIRLLRPTNSTGEGGNLTVSFYYHGKWK